MAFADRFAEVLRHLRDVQLPQPVIGAQRQDEDVGTIGGEEPVDSAQAAGRRVAAKPGIDHTPGEALRPQAILQDGWKPFPCGWRHGQAVAKDDDAAGWPE